MDTPPPAATPVAPAGEDKTVAIVSYLTIIGFIIALIIHGQKKTALGGYHLRQMLGIFISGVVCGVADVVLLFIPILGWLAICVIWICVFIMWLMGLISAIKGEMKPAPILGVKFQEWFGGAF